ncbi:uncharacterized protein LOC121416633 [Lytechinus variegatus]|uniref:uncharacterized protein LOC121416633 n=1 Tax=Lytechinus variegatus TaxID=7654 RepID=UPI001BB12633|nr:uncharacterized protein LOC121416633 [Lytechinus variegatus]
MATNFNKEQYCEGRDCRNITDVTYYVKEKKNLCDDCASKEGCIDESRKGGSYLHCEKHADKPLDMYCKTHGQALCVVCVMVDHRQSCVIESIEVAITEVKARLTELRGGAKDRLNTIRANVDEIDQCRTDTDAHLQHVEHEVDSTISEAIERDKDRENEEAAKVNQETDKRNEKLQEDILKINAEIQKNNEERNEQLEIIHAYAQIRQGHMETKKTGFHGDIKNIIKERDRKIGELEKSLRDETTKIKDAILALDKVLEDDRCVVKDGHRVDASVTNELQKTLNVDGVKEITSSISGVKFMKGAKMKHYDGRIGGYDGTWKMRQTIKVKDEIKLPVVVGCVDERNVIITDDASGSLHRPTYSLDIYTKEIKKVVTGADSSRIYSFSLLDDDRVVCGKYREGHKGDSLTGCISVYDRRWAHIKDVTIPCKRTRDNAQVDVAVDQDGMIIASERGQAKIYVISPANGKVLKTVKCRKDAVMLGVFSLSGRIVSRPYHLDNRVFITDRHGAHRDIPHHAHSHVIVEACIDPLTDVLYVVTPDSPDCKACVIDKVTSVDDMTKRMMSFPLSTRLANRWDHVIASRVIMTSSGKIIASDGENIIVFESRFTL